MALHRTLVSLIAFVTAVVIAYFAVWVGRGGGAWLSQEDASMAIEVGAGYGVILLLTLNLLSMRDRAHALKRSFLTIVGMHLVFGFGFMSWVSMNTIA